jgi:SAM-dependent methyltransferase/uncharacterized protein YbaR (Trm112 family)
MKKVFQPARRCGSNGGDELRIRPAASERRGGIAILGAVTSAASDRSALVCPETHMSVRASPIDEARERMGASVLIGRNGGRRTSLGPTATVMLREDLRCAYPVVGAIPVLMVPEQLVPENVDGPVASVDTSDPRYAESYDEMAHYNSVARREAELIEASPAAAGLSRVRDLSPERRSSFPEPRGAWLDAAYEPAAQFDAFRHLAPMTGKRVLQVGGKGTHAVRFLLAGAAEAWVMSPMVEELQHGIALARHVGVKDSYCCVAGIAEEMPFADETFDAVYSESCVHHMVTGMASEEFRRILRPGGRFAAVEPWRAPLYGWGIRLFGKREKGVHCQPMTSERAKPFLDAFDNASVIHHGALTRYPMLALAQLGWELPARHVDMIMRIDDACASRLPGLRDMGSSTAILGTRRA